MPPWHIDPSVGVQKFKNDMSLSDEQIDTIVRWVDGGALQGDPKDMPPPKPLVTDNEWQGVRDGFGQPDLVIKSSEYTMPAQHQDVWYRPMSDIPLTEPRWVKMVEIRPTNLKARKIVHHSIAYLVLNNDPDAVNTGTATGPAAATERRRPRQPPAAVDGVGDRQGLRPVPRRTPASCSCRARRSPGTSTCTPSAKRSPAGSEIGLWFYPKGQEPKKRSYLIGFTGIDQREDASTSRRTRSRTPKASRC